MYPLPFGNLPLSHPSTPWNFRDPPWGGYGYFLEPHNVPVDCDQTRNILPSLPERSGIILLKLKRKIQFGGHVHFEAARPEFIMTALNWLKANNFLYKDIQIDCTNISTKLTSIMNDEVDNTNSLPINSQNNSANSDNFVNVGVNSLTK